MATHMAERSLIQERLRSLYESLASRPAETDEGAEPQSQGKGPSGLRTQLMPHQLYALTWLKWRETQKPAGGVLGMYTSVTIIVFYMYIVLFVTLERNIYF